MVTVIALMLGLTVVALQLSLDPVLTAAVAQFSAGPAESGRAQRVCGNVRLQRGRAVHGRRLGRQPYRFFSPAGGQRRARAAVCQPRPAGVFADHLVHSTQVDAIMNAVERSTLAVIRDGLSAGGQDAPEVPGWAVPIASPRSGYVQAVRPGRLLAQAAGYGVCLRFRPRVGEHVVAGTTLAWIWRASLHDPAPTRGPSCRCWTRGSGSDSSAPWSKTPPLASGN
jgi:hypothetical protein